ncbi:MEDS domain-containing protein [Halorussus sp. AFM4]|uniref:MEDS domain-containing protein n=1 Tax=Halorussus sp. AFM4 TaxID=3421651 RepID=UPI003EC09DAB
MSEHPPPAAGAPLEPGLEALETGPEFRGPVERLDGHHCNDHFAQIYETDEERFAAAVSFARHGLESGERVMYVVDEDREAEVRAALRDGGVDVAAAVHSGALSFHTASDTYLRNDSFEPDEMVEFYGDTVAEADAAYEGLRIVAETSWLDGDRITYEQFMEYEAKVNRLFDAENCVALCQYDRSRFPPEFVRNIVRSHPHLIHDGAVSHNVYYTPPEEVFDDDPAREVDRMLGTLRERTEAKDRLQRRDRFLREFHAVTADRTLSFEEKVRALLDLGREQFDLAVGGLNRVDPDADHFEVEYLSGDHDHFEPGAEFPLSDTYCQAAADIRSAALVTDPAAEGLADIPVFEEFGIEGYLGTYVPVDGGPDRTLGFLPAASESASFSAEDRMYLELMGQWIGHELNRRQRERFLRECYETTSDPTLSFEEKLDALFDLGRRQFGLEIGGLSRVDPETDLFEIEHVSGDHDHFEPGARADLSETYCRLVTEDGATAAVTDPVDAGFEDRVCYERFGVRTYLGTHLTVEGGPDRTFWFVSTEPRETPITDEERTFVHLMGQWVKYELERRQRERQLERTKTRFETVFEQSNDGVLLVDPEADELVDANAAAARMLGYARDELASLRPSDIHPNEREQCRAFLDRALETGSAWSEDLHCRTRDGRDVPTEISAAAVSLDGRELVLANVRPIDERKTHERYQRELYETVADSTAPFEAKLADLLELGCDRFGLEIGYFARTDDDDAFEIIEAVGGHDRIEPGVTDSLSNTYCEKLLASPDPVSVRSAAEAGWTDDPAYERFGLDAYFATTVNVGNDEHATLCFASETPREQPFAKAERTFLDLMGQCVSYELERTHREAQLRQKNDRLESFASMLAHELRNPVTIGQIYGQQLSGEQNAEAIDYVTEAFDRIEDMVDVLLILTRGREAVGERAPIDLGDAARDVWETVEAPDAALRVDLDRTIEADETYVSHLFRNLLDNAVEHGSTGREAQSHDAVEQAGADVTVTVGDLPSGFYVADDGVGIPEDEREAVFDEGYTTAADSGGTGLGLAFVRKLAEVYEWEVSVTESESGGARFEFRNVA